MHMYSFYVSQSVLFVSFDLARSTPLKRYLTCDFRVSILETSPPPPFDVHFAYLYPRQARATHLHMGVGLGFLADYRTGSAPSSGKKSNAFTGHWSREQTVHGENKASEKSKSKADQQSPKKIGN